MKRDRRKFLKKALYHTPVLVLLGELGRPKTLWADFSGGPPGPPGGGSPFGSANQQTSPTGRSLLQPRRQLRF